MNLIQTLTLILIRLFGLIWALTGLVRLIAAIAMVGVQPLLVMPLAPSLVSTIAGFLCWILAPLISERVTGRNFASIPEVPVPERENLYATTFVGLGTYFTLSSFGKAFNWFHYFIVYRQDPHGFYMNESPSYYELTEVALTLAGGVILFFQSDRLAKKMNQKQAKRVPATD